MANIWENCVITNKGIELQARMMAGESINITSVKVGAGSVPVSELPEQLAVTNIKQTASLRLIHPNYDEDESTIIIPVVLSNTGLTSSYYLRQVGFYATDTNGEEILYAIAQNTEARYIPTEEECPSYTLRWAFHFTLSNNVNITVNADLAGYVTVEELETIFKKGTYIGNGIEDIRKIEIGGTGEWLAVRTESGVMGFITYSGATMFSVTAGTYAFFNSDDVNFKNGVLTIASVSRYLNESGTTYTYQVL